MGIRDCYSRSSGVACSSICEHNSCDDAVCDSCGGCGSCSASACYDNGWSGVARAAILNREARERNRNGGGGRCERWELACGVVGVWSIIVWNDTSLCIANSYG